MTLKAYDNLDFSSSINITKTIPLYQKLLDGLDVTQLISEMNTFIANKTQDTTPWLSAFDVSMDPVKEELTANGLLVGYNQHQLTQKQNTAPWQTWFDEVGTYTKNMFETKLSGFNRPRYVYAQPGWEVKNHSDWDSNSKHGLRCHLILEHNDKCRHYVTDDDGTEHEINMQPGEVWFYNVQKTHRAENLGSTVRSSLSFELFNDTLIA